MANKKDPTLCVTCHTELAPNMQIAYFSQDPLCPTRDDDGFCEEVRRMIAHMEALFQAIGDEEIHINEEIIPELGRLGTKVAGEARRRMRLLQDAQRIRELRFDMLRKRLGEEEVG